MEKILNIFIGSFYNLALCLIKSNRLIGVEENFKRIRPAVNLMCFTFLGIIGISPIVILERIIKPSNTRLFLLIWIAGIYLFSNYCVRTKAFNKSYAIVEDTYKKSFKFKQVILYFILLFILMAFNIIILNNFK
jgi:hypothetical protein